MRHDTVAILAKPGLLSPYDNPEDRTKRITPFVTAKIRLPNMNRREEHVYVTCMHLGESFVYISEWVETSRKVMDERASDLI